MGLTDINASGKNKFVNYKYKIVIFFSIGSFLLDLVVMHERNIPKEFDWVKFAQESTSTEKLRTEIWNQILLRAEVQFIFLRS